MKIEVIANEGEYDNGDLRQRRDRDCLAQWMSPVRHKDHYCWRCTLSHVLTVVHRNCSIQQAIKKGLRSAYPAVG